MAARPYVVRRRLEDGMFLASCQSSGDRIRSPPEHSDLPIEDTSKMRELYVILGVRENATNGDVRKAYRKLARKYHPDINPGNDLAAERYDRITEAYEVLSDPEKRGFYDTHGYYTEGALEKPTRPRLGFSFGPSVSGDPDSTGFADLFDDFFAAVRSRQEPQTSLDVETQLPLGFEDAIRGVQASVNVYRRRVCQSCRGMGRAPGSREFGCPACEGSGDLVRARGHLRFAVTCPECEGSGRVAPACRACRGEGQTVAIEPLPVQLPPGVSSGSRVRFSGLGNVDPKTGRTGDLIVVTNVEDHPFFRRVGDNIHCTVPVTVSEAALGARIEVPSLDGVVSLKVPPGTQSGQMLRLRGRGAPSLRADGAHGDQYVEVRVVVPRPTDERSREILRELATLETSNPRRDLVHGR
jgi:molecular chaperone DnaJ